MTLRRRLLLVYLIVVLLSCATVAIAVRELQHSRRVVDDLRRWQDIVLNVEKLRTAFERDALLKLAGASELQPITLAPEEADFPTLLARTRQYLDFDEVRWTVNKLLAEYETWRDLAEAGDPRRFEQTNVVRGRLEDLTKQLEERLNGLLASAEKQDQRVGNLLLLVLGLTLVHIVVVGTMLRVWLLRPVERLLRQVAALGRDEPAPEPLVRAPAELASLARALEDARLTLEAMRNQIVEAERMTTVGQLAAQLAHNLRNPLASIRAAAQVAARRGHMDGYASDRLDEIIAATDRLDRWVSGLVEFVRPSGGAFEVCEVGPLLEHVRAAVAADAAAKEVNLAIEANGVRLRCEPRSLEQAFIAVVVNAIEASPVGGRVEIRAGAQDGGSDGTREVVVSVADEGPGLPDGPAEQVFELRFSTKRTGLGIGLTLAKQTVQRQGGRVTARTRAQGGAVIEFRLPASEVSVEGGGHAANPGR